MPAIRRSRSPARHPGRYVKVCASQHPGGNGHRQECHCNRAERHNAHPHTSNVFRLLACGVPVHLGIWPDQIRTRRSCAQAIGRASVVLLRGTAKTHRMDNPRRGYDPATCIRHRNGATAPGAGQVGLPRSPSNRTSEASPVETTHHVAPRPVDPSLAAPAGRRRSSWPSSDARLGSACNDSGRSTVMRIRQGPVSGRVGDLPGAPEVVRARRFGRERSPANGRPPAVL
jgi:hypothetical protein